MGCGLIHAPTGHGKTVSAVLPILQDYLEHPDRYVKGKLQLIWITPLRALASDTLHSISGILEDLDLAWQAESRTGDTSSSRKARQRKRMPEILVTTPESLSLLLSYPESRDLFDDLKCAVVDEWHELLSSKRGVQTELGLTRLRRWRPGMKTWGLSATLSNLTQAAEVLAGTRADSSEPISPLLIEGNHRKKITIDSLIPASIDVFPWAGHMGLTLADRVVEELEASHSSLVFTNTRSQSESWFQTLCEKCPHWAGQIAIHHGSIEKAEREEVESGLKSGALKVVVCTSSLDLGVDFLPVELVVQIGGPKGVARLLQRAGRSGHQPGRTSRIVCVPTHALELVEYAAVRQSVKDRIIEPRIPGEKPLDLLSQHLITVCLGQPDSPGNLFDEVRRAWSYRNLTRDEFDWVLDFIQFGGKSLKAYQSYAKLVTGPDGMLSVREKSIEKFHRLSIGTIASDTAVAVKFMSGKSLGSVEENFISRLKKGQGFVFAGLHLELVKFHNNTALVKRSKSKKPSIPAWEGGKAPLSSELADAVLNQFHRFLENKSGNSKVPLSKELRRVGSLLDRQMEVSSLPVPGKLIIESTIVKKRLSYFVFTFGGRLVHEGLAALIAHRITRKNEVTIVTAVNDYGFHISLSHPLEISPDEWQVLLSPDRLDDDLLECLNTSEMARRQFREIARIAGLVFSGYPGAAKSNRQVQVSSQLLFDVFTQYEPDHLLLDQSRREVLQKQMEFQRLSAILENARSARMSLNHTEKLSPLAFPLWAEMIRGEVSSEPWQQRVEAMARSLDDSSS